MNAKRKLRVVWSRLFSRTVAPVWPVLHPETRDSRKWLLTLLLALVVAVLATLIWLASMYETSQAQEMADRGAVSGAMDIRMGLEQDLQSLQALQTPPVDDSTWSFQAETLLHERREFMQVFWLDADMKVRLQAFSPYSPALSDPQALLPSWRQTCMLAAQNGSVSYSSSYFDMRPNGMGQEMVDVCQVLRSESAITGYQVATYSLKALLTEMLAKPAQRIYELSFVDQDGARLAVINFLTRRSSRAFTAQQAIQLPGHDLTLRLLYWHEPPSLFPNVLTAVVTFLAIALVTVVSLLTKDMRRRQRAEQEVAQALAFRNAMENSLITGLRARDLSGCISYVNPAFCEMVGFSAEELLGTGMPAPYWPPESIDVYFRRQELLRGANRLPPRIGYESVFMRRDGTRFPVLIYEAPLLDAAGEQSGWMSAVIDISEQRRMEEHSRASQERLQATARLATVGEMASLISHEINQPLAAISSYATGALNLLSRPEGAEGTEGTDGMAAKAASTDVPGQQTRLLRTAVAQIVAQAERAGKVVTSVRDFVRRRHQAHELVRPDELKLALDPLLALQARKLGVELQWQIAPDLPAVLCDRIMIEQVLLNLARNGMQAMEHTKPHLRRLRIGIRHMAAGRVADAAAAAQVTPVTTEIATEIAAEPGWTALQFDVADCGAGIAPELSEQLFTHFFSTKRDGMGLGLSLCRTVIEQHGGQLGFEANQPCGTIFWFTLPLTAEV